MLERGVPASPTVRGVWFDEIIDEPDIVDRELRQAWGAFVADLDAEADERTAFFERFERKGWVVFEVANTESDVPGVAWVVVDVEAEVNEEADE